MQVGQEHARRNDVLQVFHVGEGLRHRKMVVERQPHTRDDKDHEPAEGHGAEVPRGTANAPANACEWVRIASEAVRFLEAVFRDQRGVAPRIGVRRTRHPEWEVAVDPLVAVNRLLGKATEHLASFGDSCRTLKSNRGLEVKLHPVPHLLCVYWESVNSTLPVPATSTGLV